MTFLSSRLPPRRKRAPMGVRTEARVFQGHRQWIRGHQCVVRDCKVTPIECAHVRNSDHTPHRDKAGMGHKPMDAWTVPLCWHHHREQSDVGEAEFERRYGLDLGALAMAFAAKSPHRHRWERPNV